MEKKAIHRTFQKAHFVGIGGIGMSGIAEVLVNLGYTVSGSDIADGPIVQRLAGMGARIEIGHAEENLNDAQVLVYSSAVDTTNPEVAEAIRRKIPVIPRAEMLAELMRMKYSVAVSGSHGKTSTTSMIATILSDAGFDPTIVLGGRLEAIDSNARLGDGDYLVAEADESDRSFLKLLPTLAVVTNIDTEHMDTYSDLADIQDAFVEFVNKVPFYGLGVLCIDEPEVQSILPRIERRFITYGFSSQADLQARNEKYEGFGCSFDLYWRNENLGRVSLNIPGKHTIANALAAMAIALELQVDPETMIKSMAGFQNADRRMQKRGEVNEVLFLDDYGHHPTEIKATLKTLKQSWNRRIVCIFQPHRYSRCEALMEDFWSSFNDSDVLVVTDIYAASEKPIAGVTAEVMAEGIKSYGHRDSILIDKLEDIPAYLMERLEPGDIVITLGAGNVWKVGVNTYEMYKKELGL